MLWFQKQTINTRCFKSHKCFPKIRRLKWYVMRSPSLLTSVVCRTCLTDTLAWNEVEVLGVSKQNLNFLHKNPKAGVLSNTTSIMRLGIKSGRVANFKLKPISHEKGSLELQPRTSGRIQWSWAEPWEWPFAWQPSACGSFKQCS